MIKLFQNYIGFYKAIFVCCIGAFVASCEASGIIMFFQSANSISIGPVPEGKLSLYILLIGLFTGLLLKFYIENLVWNANIKLSSLTLKNAIKLKHLSADPSILTKNTLDEAQNIAVNVLYPTLIILSRLLYLFSFSLIVILSGLLSVTMVSLLIFMALIFVSFSIVAKYLAKKRSEYLTLRYQTALNVIQARKELIQINYEEPFLTFNNAVAGFSLVTKVFRLSQLSLKPTIEILLLSVFLGYVYFNDLSDKQVDLALTDNLVYFPLLIRLYPSVIDLVSNFNKILYSSFDVREFSAFDTKIQCEKIGLSLLTKKTYTTQDTGWVLKIVDYPLSSSDVNLNLILVPDRKVHLDGPSGIGKSTAIEDIFLHGAPSVRESVFLNMRSNTCMPTIYYSPQTTKIFDGTVLDNIILGRTERHLDVFLNKIKLIDDEFITRNLYKRLTSSNPNISGGEVQRIGILRALYGQPDILILDEPFSALDDTNKQFYERFIIDNSKAVLIISHIKVCDAFEKVKVD